VAERPLGAHSQGFLSMSDFDRGFARPGTVAAPDMAVDAGLRAFMLGVYNKLGLGLILSAALSYVTGTVPAVGNLLFRTDAFGRTGYTTLGYVVAFAPIGILLFQRFARQQSPQSAAFTYWSIVGLFGASMGAWFHVYQIDGILQTFLVTAGAFGGLSLVGYTTKKDLTAMGSFLIFAINLIGVGIFAGLIAYDTQRLKMTYYQIGGNEAALNMATSYGALSLYLDFINLFQFLLYFMGGSRR